MSDLTRLDNGNVPAAMAGAFKMDDLDDLTSGVSGGYPIISYKGKVWAVTSGGEKHLVLDDNGDPRPSIDVVLVKANPHISKIYYPGGYEEGSTERPSCYSNDGITPGLDAAEPQAAKCAVCPHNQWGSRISEAGSKGKACSDTRRVAVVSLSDLDTPMLMRIPAASLREMANYAQVLKRRNTPYQAVVTKIGFDPEAAYPRFTFRAVRYLDETEAKSIIATGQQDVIGQITTLTMQEYAADQAAAVDALGQAPAHVAAMAQAVEPDAPKPSPPSEVQAQSAPDPTPMQSKLLDDAASELDAVLAGFDDVDD